MFKWVIGLASLFLVLSAEAGNRNPAHRQCLNDTCIGSICRANGGCEDSDTLHSFLRACKGADAICIQELCEERDCTRDHKALAAINECVGPNGRCMEAGFLNGLQDRFEPEVRKACQTPVDGECVVAACRSSRQCEDINKFEGIAEACRGM